MFNKAPYYMMVVMLGIKSKLVYRIGTLLNTVGIFIEFFGRIMIWVALLTSGKRFETTLPEMITFMVLSMVLEQVVSSSSGSVIAQHIRDGSISFDFVRPINIKAYLFFNDIGNNIFSALVVFLPICVIMSHNFGFSPPASSLHGLFFLTSACLGLVMRFYYSYILGLFSFWLLKNPFTSWHFRNVEMIFAGLFMPIWMYPAWLASITQFLPFRYFIYEPLAFYLGKTPIDSIWRIIMNQFVWLAVLHIIERLLWRKACHKVIVQGG